MKNTELRELYEDFCKANNQIIEDKNRDDILPICVIIEEDENDKTKPKCGIIGFQQSNYEEKRMAREFLFKTIMEKKTIGYILIQDAKMTCMEKSPLGDKHEVKDVVIRGFYSPKLKLKEFVVYDNAKKKIIEVMKITDSEKQDGDMDKDGSKVIDEWDLYGEWWDEENPKHRKINQDYAKYKRENPEKYGTLGEDGSIKK
jgi:hypothetical protein